MSSAARASSRAALAPRSMLDAPPADRKRTAYLASGGAVLAHAGLIALAVTFGARVVRSVAPASVTQMMDVELPRPEPKPEPAVEPPAPEPAPQKRARAPAPRPSDAVREAPPPAAAQAGQVLAASNEVVDFGDEMVVGSGSTYAGGVTESGGTAKTAVRDTRARAGGVLGGTGTNLAGDRSRVAQLAGGGSWDCPFPEEADAAGIDSAVVSLRVQVASSGAVESVAVVRDPGDGFGREARRCALRKRWAPALDRAGSAIGSTAIVNVRFVRR